MPLGARAAIPEPDIVLYGTPRVGAALLGAGGKVAVRNASDVEAVFTITDPAAGYVVSVPLVQLFDGESRPAGMAVLPFAGSIACVLPDGRPTSGAALAQVTDRGTIRRVDFDCGSPLSGSTSTTTTTTPTSSSTSSTAQNGSTTSTSTPGGTTTSTTVPLACGDGDVDAEEECGEPGLTCASDERCVGCRCELCPNATLDCADWVGALDGGARVARILVVPGEQPVSGVTFDWSDAQTEDVRAAIDGSSGLVDAQCVDAPAEAHCGVTAEGALQVSATASADGVPGARLSVTSLVDAEGLSFEGCALPPGCCVVDADCAVSDFCVVAPTCGADNHCSATTPVDCDDDVFCNGTETCSPTTGCGSGEPPVVDDGIACTDDRCDEESDQVQHVGRNEACDDEDDCTVDTCESAEGCRNLAVDAGLPDGAGIQCAVSNFERVLPTSQGLVAKRRATASKTLVKIEGAVRAASRATKARACQRKLKQAGKLSAKLERRLETWSAKGVLGDPTQAAEVVRLATALADRVAAAQAQVAVFCAPGA